MTGVVVALLCNLPPRKMADNLVFRPYLVEKVAVFLIFDARGRGRGGGYHRPGRSKAGRTVLDA